MESKSATIVKFNQLGIQEVDGIKKLSGFVKLKNLIGVIDALDLEANPRAAKTGQVTNDIQESLENTPDTFPFKTKGILLATAEYEELERNRYRLFFDKKETEGILDGGHNTLAIGLYILRQCLDYAGEKMPKIKSWSDFKDCWQENRELVGNYCKALRESEPGEMPDTLDTFVPVELLLPADRGGYEVQDTFHLNLLDICEARNNNVQLTVGTKANKIGYFDELKSILSKRDPALAERVEWKLNDGGEIKVDDIVALAWIPLSLVCPVVDENGKEVEAPAPSQLYSGKGNALKSFDRFMSSPTITYKSDKDYKHELISNFAESAFEVAVAIPELYDYIFENFGDLYNKAGGSYGRIGVVKKLNTRRKKTTPYGKRTIETLSPAGFIAPLVYGLQALMEVDETGDDKVVKWTVDPLPWLEDHLPAIVGSYSDILALCEYDPQKVGKAPQSYNRALEAFKMANAGIL